MAFAPMRTVRARLSPDDGHGRLSDLSRTARVLAMWVGGSLTSVLIWGGTVANGPGWEWLRQLAGVFGQASIVAGGAFMVGSLLGFLFGIPRTVQGDPAQGRSDGAAQPASLQSTNTNLEQISDWLTKILVGVGLTQLQNLRGELAAMGAYFAIASSPSVTLALILNFTIIGFLSGYLLTRLFLTGAFQAVERSLRTIQQRTTKAESLEQAGDFLGALTEYESALLQVTATTPTVEKRQVYEGLIFNSLYEPPPQGFHKAIAHATQYQEEHPDGLSARGLAYLAAAYGQQYAYEQERNAQPQRLDEIKLRALEAAKRAVARDAGVTDLLRMMWNPDHPGKSPGDDDLEPFHDDAQFRALLG